MIVYKKVEVKGMEEQNGIMDARTLACYIIDYYKNNLKKTDDISPLKLQKALYFCFAYWGGFIRKNKSFSNEKKEIILDYSEILFENDIEAWVYGPVVPDVYKSFKDSTLFEYKEKNIFENKKYVYVKEFIDNILDDVLNTNDFRLVEISHDDACWKKNFKPKSMFHNLKIKPEEIIKEYATKIA